MSIFKRFLFSFVFLLGASTALVAGPVSDHGLLQVKDGKLSAAEGKGGDPVQLRGMSLYWSNWGATWWNESAVDQAVDYLGCEILRAPMSVGSKDDTTGKPKDVDGGYLTNPDANVAWVKTVVEEANYKDIYVIIDWHDHAAETHQDEAVAFFTQMASKYGNMPNVVFEIYNEPITTDWSGTIKPYAETVIDAIRSTPGADGALTQNVIIVGTPFYSQMGSAVPNDPITGRSNIAYAVHFYAASHPLSGGIGQSTKDAVAKGLCVIATEWGTVNYDGKGTPSQKNSQEWVDWMSSNKISWCNWSLNDKNDNGETASMFKTGTTPLGPWKDADLTVSGAMVKPWLPAPTTEFSVSPSLLKFFYVAGSKSSTVTKGSYTEATSDHPEWLSVSPPSGPEGQVIDISVGQYDSTKENRTGNITFTDPSGHKAKVKVVQMLNEGNLALGKTAVASSFEGNYKASNATDGDAESTRWGSTFSDPQWIYVDLGQDTDFNLVTLAWEAAYSSHYHLQLAMDGSDPADSSSYAEFYDSGTIAAGRGKHQVGVSFAAVQRGRYVRLWSDSRITAYGVSLYEIKIFRDRYIFVWGSSDLRVYAGESNQKIEIRSNVVWTATSSADWLTINPTTGGSDARWASSYPTISYAPNYTAADRTAYLTFTAPGALSKTLKVTQPAETHLYYTSDASGNPLRIRLYAMAGERVDNPDGSTDVTFTVLSDYDFYALPQEGWLTITSTDATHINVHAAPNTTGAYRNGLVVIRTSTYPLLADVWVGQDPWVPQPPYLTLGSSSWSSTSGNADSTTVAVSSNVNWTATSSDTSWLTVAPPSGSNSGSLTLSVTANTGSATRTGTVAVISSDGTLSASVAVSQSAQPTSPTLSVTPATWSPSGSGGSRTITITSNVSWSATSDATWLTFVSPASGSNNGSVTLNANTNGTTGSRTGTVTITGGGLTRTVTVSQTAQGNAKVLSAVPASLTVDAAGGTFSVAINSNTDWWDWSEVAWLTIVTERGSGNGTLTFRVSSNTGAERTTAIKLQGNGVSEQSITITQSGTSADRWTPPADGGTQLMMITRTGSWTATSSDSSWLTVTPTSGTGNGSISLTASANAGPARNATVTIAGGGSTKAIQVTQAAVPPVTTTLNITRNWTTGGPHGNGGYCADVVVKNNSSAPVDWSVTFTLPETSAIYDSWNGIWSQSGSQVTVEGVSWNNILQPGQSTESVGFCANR